MCRSSNDAFTNQHSLIPPSFGGPQIHVALPRVLGLATSESVTTVSCESESAARTVESSEVVTEMGHDVVKDLLPDGMNSQQPDDLMSAAEESSISAAGAGFDAALRRASAPEAADIGNKQHCLDDKYVDALVTDDSPGSFHNGLAACSAAWHALNPSLGQVASDSSIASSVGSLLDGTGMDISGLVCRTAAVAGHSSFKTHAMTEQSSCVDTAVGDVDDSLAEKTETSDRDDDTQQHMSRDLSVKGHENDITQQHCVK